MGRKEKEEGRKEEAAAGSMELKTRRNWTNLADGISF